VSPVKEAPGASQSGAPVDRIDGLQKQRDNYVFEKTGRRPSPPRGC
jgi:hypothetical protein